MTWSWSAEILYGKEVGVGEEGGQVSGWGWGMPVRYVHMTYNFLEAEHQLAFGPFVWENHCFPFLENVQFLFTNDILQQFACVSTCDNVGIT